MISIQVIELADASGLSLGGCTGEVFGANSIEPLGTWLRVSLYCQAIALNIGAVPLAVFYAVEIGGSERKTLRLGVIFEHQTTTSEDAAVNGANRTNRDIVGAEGVPSAEACQHGQP
jgi:hypothetical protein